MINDESDEKYIIFTKFIQDFLVSQRTKWIVEEPDKELGKSCRILMDMVQEYYDEDILDEMKNCRFTVIQGSSYEKSCMIIPCKNSEQTLYYIIIDKHLFDFYKIIIDIYKFDCEDDDNIVLEDLQKLITAMAKEYAAMKNKEVGELFFSLYNDSLHDIYHTYDASQNPFNFLQLFFLITHELGHCFIPYMSQKVKLICNKRNFLLESINDVNFIDVATKEKVDKKEIKKIVLSNDDIIEECLCDSISIDCYLRFQEELDNLGEMRSLFVFLLMILSSQIISFSNNVDNLNYHNNWLIRIIHFRDYILNWYEKHDRKVLIEPFLYGFYTLYNKFFNRVGMKCIRGIFGNYNKLNNLYSKVSDSNYKSYYKLSK